MSDKVFAPWTAIQVDNLNRFQRFEYLHPFTCPETEDHGDRALVATRLGWVCCHCNYQQDWAHADMAAFDADTAKRARETFNTYTRRRRPLT